MRAPASWWRRLRAGAGAPRLWWPALAVAWASPAPAAAGAGDAPLPATAQAQVEGLLAPLLQDRALSRASVGLVVQRLSDAQVLFAHRPDGLLVPASNVKLITTATALTVLGPDYQFATEVYGDIGRDGRIAGDLYVKGFGDPYLVPERLWQLASRLRYLGLTEVAGNLVVDDSFFAGDARAAGLAGGHQLERLHGPRPAPYRRPSTR